MKKMFITLLVALFVVTGCNITKVSDKSVSDIFETILYHENNLSNTHMEGYSLYLPKGVKVIDKNDYNLKIKDSNNYYYLYIDTVAYHYKVANAFTEKSNHFYSTKIEHDGKIGYVDIVKKDDDYAVVIMYNYSKIETIIDKNTFNSSIRTIASILSSIKYNDSVIGDNIGNDRKVFKEEQFDLFDSNIENENFLKYEEEYGTYKGQIDVNKDNDIIDVDETIE